MLQKQLVIAMCAIFALSACGGDDKDDQSRIVLNPPEDINPPPEEDDEEEEAPVEWLNVVFATETDVDAWEAACVTDGCNATADLSYNADAEAMDVNPEFLTADDQIEISAPIDPEIADMTGGNAHLNLFVPEAYAGMIAQVFFQNAGDQKAYIGYTETSAGWNTFSFESPEPGTGVDNDFGDFGYHPEGFDLTLINRMGVQIQSAEGFVGVEGTLHIDDAIVSPEAIEVAEKDAGEPEPPTEEPIEGAPAAPPTGDISDHFTDDIDGWHLNGTGNTTTTETDQIALTHDAVNGALRITPKSWEANAAEGYRYESRIEVEATDMTSALVRMVVYIPEAYITDGGLELQVVAGGSYGANITDLSAGFNTLDVDLSARGDDLTAVTTLGLQLSVAPTDTSIVEPILVTSVDAYLDGEIPATEPEGIAVDMTSGWRASGDLTVSYSEAGVSYQPEAASDQMVFDPAGPADYAGADIVFTYEVDQAFIDSGANLQPFFQLKDYASWDYHFCWIGNGDLALGEQTFTCTIPATLENGNAPTIPDGQTAQVGVQTNGGGAGTVTISSVTINLAE